MTYYEEKLSVLEKEYEKIKQEYERIGAVYYALSSEVDHVRKNVMFEVIAKQFNIQRIYQLEGCVFKLKDGHRYIVLNELLYKVKGVKVMTVAKSHSGHVCSERDIVEYCGNFNKNIEITIK